MLTDPPREALDERAIEAAAKALAYAEEAGPFSEATWDTVEQGWGESARATVAAYLAALPVEDLLEEDA